MQIEQKAGKRYGAEFSWGILLFDTPWRRWLGMALLLGRPCMYQTRERIERRSGWQVVELPVYAVGKYPAAVFFAAAVSLELAIGQIYGAGLLAAGNRFD